MLRFQRIIRIHFSLLLLLLFNFGLKELIGYGINNTLVIGLKIILYLTGIVLFFRSVRPFKKASIYYSYYLCTPTVLAMIYILNGIFLGLLSSILLAPMMPIQPDYNDGNIKVYSRFKGFLAGCCTYYATQDKLLVFEEFRGTIYTEGELNFDNAKIILKNDSAIIRTNKIQRVKLN